MLRLRLQAVFKSRFCLELQSRAFPKRFSSSRAFDCARDALSLIQFRRLRPEHEQFQVFIVHRVLCRHVCSHAITFSTSLSPRKPWLTVHRGCEIHQETKIKCQMVHGKNKKKHVPLPWPFLMNKCAFRHETIEHYVVC